VLHRPASTLRAALVLTHGAGANCNSPLLIALAEAFAETGVLVLRCDLPFRQRRPHGPPRPGEAAEDRAGLRRALAALRAMTSQPIWLGGHSYGGRQASMLAGEEPGTASALLLLSYPLHPPHKPAQMRIAHFPSLRTPALFVQGARDGFATQAEMEQAIKLIPAPVRFMLVEAAGHDLGFGSGRQRPSLPASIISELFSVASLCDFPSAGTRMQ
jgi:predicted alpha/beta-hydrolase family hydrolase